MEKLQPVIKHHFWILLAVALLVPVIGWWSASSKLAAEIDDRTKTLDSTFSGIPSGSGSPNQSWVDAVAARNQVREQKNRIEQARLWNMQKQRFVWPVDIREDMQDCPFHGRIEGSSFGRAARVPDLYRDDYDLEIQKLWQIPDPLRLTPDQMGIVGKVEFPITAIPRIPRRQWDQVPPSWEEIWDAQEDIWLMTDLLLAIDQLNQGANSIGDANIRRIEEIRLFGGSRGPASSGGGGGDGAMGGMGSMGDMAMGDMAMGGMPGMMMGGMGGMGDMGSMGDMGGRGSVSADFNLNEEFSNVDTSMGRGGAASNAMGGMGSMNSGGMAGYADAMGGGMMPGGDVDAGDPASARGASAGNRYVDNEEGAPYRTRGFYLKLVVDHRRLPDLLVELTNCRWPVEIVRVQQVALHRDPRGTRGGGMNSSGMPGMGGVGGTAADGMGDYAAEMGDGGLPGDMAGSSMMNSMPGTGANMYGSGGYGGANAGKGISQSAMSDPNLATVVIAGLMTIYNPPPESLAVADPATIGEGTTPADAVSETAPIDAATEPPADAADASIDAPATEGGTSEAATPDDGTGLNTEATPGAEAESVGSPETAPVDENAPIR